MTDGIQMPTQRKPSPRKQSGWMEIFKYLLRTGLTYIPRTRHPNGAAEQSSRSSVSIHIPQLFLSPFSLALVKSYELPKEPHNASLVAPRRPNTNTSWSLDRHRVCPACPGGCNRGMRGGFLQGG
jgi:hypothetical protein